MSERLLTRSRVLAHPSGVTFTTPILVPSFSSKGLPSSKPSVSLLLETSAEWLTDAMLISAYDVHYGHIPPPGELPCKPDLSIVDSGGYEAGFDEDMSAVAVREHQPEPWAQEDLKSVLDTWPERFAAVFVSYDHPKHRIPLAEQIAEANALFRHYPKQMHSLLLKPATMEQHSLMSVLKEVSADPSILKGFDIIGVTEKELGSNALDRMHRIAELRLDLDEKGVTAPIQVFGALDPLSSCLYFVSGAEIFDGLTWLRYAYVDGMCVYRANYGALSVGLDCRDTLVDAKTMVDNVHYLHRLELSMRRVALDNDFEQFSYHVPFLNRAFGDLRAKLKGRI